MMKRIPSFTHKLACITPHGLTTLHHYNVLFAKLLFAREKVCCVSEIGEAESANGSPPSHIDLVLL